MDNEMFELFVSININIKKIGEQLEEQNRIFRELLEHEKPLK